MSELAYLIERSRTQRHGNHTFTLINDSEKLYIYDPTALLMLEVINPYKAKVINGGGEVTLYPRISFLTYSGDKKEIDTISKLFELKDLSSPYTRKDFIVTAEENIELFNKSTSLLDDFHTEAKSDIDGIVTATDRLVKARRK